MIQRILFDPIILFLDESATDNILTDPQGFSLQYCVIAKYREDLKHPIKYGPFIQ